MDTLSLKAARRAIQQAQRTGAHGERSVACGPLLATFDGASSLPNRNYAVPGDELPTPEDVGALIELYRSRELLPRMELLAPGPALLDALLAGGLRIQKRHPIMALDHLRPAAAAGFSVGTPVTREDFFAAADVASRAYGDGPAVESDADRLQGAAARGDTIGLARHVPDGATAGSGILTAAAHGVVTIAAVATAEQFRRRGVASAVVTHLTRVALDAGLLPWLECESDNEVRLYGALGYVTIGEEVVLVA